jgi:hypothetical protein
MAEDLDDHKPPCIEQQRLMAVLQGHLLEVTKLTQTISDALASGNENYAAALDNQLELVFGKRQRALDALYQHRKDHGC